MANKFGADIFIAAASSDSFRNFKDLEQSHRDSCHLFFIQEKGTVSFEVDFQMYNIPFPAVMYIHPNQIHRSKEIRGVTGCFLAINNENLNPEYLKLLEEITPVKPLVLSGETFAIITESASFCIKISERQNEKLYHSMLKDSCNALVALILSQYLVQSIPTDGLSRYEIITKSFKTILDQNYIAMKRPVEYAQKMNLSTAYLNECIKKTTGYPISYHIQQRIILEAKRLLYHSDKSVKEIAIELGYDDYPYFSRLFTKIAGISALAFRNKNHD